jgi:hypothetical protein
VYASEMDSAEKTPALPSPAKDNFEQSPRDAWLEQQASAVSEGYNVFFDPYDHLARRDEPND